MTGLIQLVTTATEIPTPRILVDVVKGTVGRTTNRAQNKTTPMSAENASLFLGQLDPTELIFIF